MIRRSSVLLAFFVVLAGIASCKGVKVENHHICKINSACFECPSDGAILECVKKKSGTEAGCKPAECK